VKIKKLFPEYQYVFNPINMGFARACNLGIRFALQQGAEYILLLNGDMIVTPNFLEPMIEFLEESEKAGIASGKVLYWQEKSLLIYAGGNVQSWRGSVFIRGSRKRDINNRAKPYKTNFCAGEMLLIKRRIIEEAGFLPDEYFFGIEDWDFSVQVKRKGFELYVVPTAIAYHETGASHDKLDVKYIYNYFRNKLIFQHKYLPKPMFWLWYLAFRIYIRYLYTVRYSKVYGDSISPDILVFAAEKALADQRGTTAIFEEDLIKFDTDLEEYKKQSQHLG